MNKKGLLFLLMILLTVCLVAFAACDNGDTTEDESTPADEQTTDEQGGEAGALQPVDNITATIVGGSIGGAWATIGEGLAEIIRTEYAGSTVAYEVGSEAANIVLVAEGKVEMGIAHTGLLNLADSGDYPFTSQYGSLRALCVLYGEACEQFFLRADTDIASFEDIVDNQYPLKVNFNTKDSFMQLVGTSVLDFYGASIDNIASWGGTVDYMNMSNSIDLMRDGKLDAYSNLIQVPSSNIVDATTSMKLVMLSLSDECCDYLNSLYGTYTTTIPAGSYSFVNQDIQTVAAKVILFCSTDMPDDVAYSIVSAIYNNFEYFKSIHSSLANVTSEDLFNTDDVPLHDGAQAFYDEVSGK